MNTYKQLYIDYLFALKNEILLYKDEENIWKLEGDITNSPGNLCLHLSGNLKHFFGTILGNTDYVRERDLEFSRKNVSREDLIKDVDETISVMEKVFDGLTLDDVNNIYPIDKFGENVTYGFVFSRLISHLSYHIGQINYHRRILDN